MESIERSIDEFDKSQSITNEIGEIRVALQGILWNLGERNLVEQDFFKLQVADVMKTKTATDLYVRMIENNYSVALKLQDAALLMPHSSETRGRILRIVSQFSEHIAVIQEARREFSNDIKSINSYQISPFVENPPQEMIDSMHQYVDKYSDAISEPSMGIQSYIYELISLRFDALSELREERKFYERISQIASYLSLALLALSSILVIFTKFNVHGNESAG